MKCIVDIGCKIRWEIYWQTHCKIYCCKPYKPYLHVIETAKYIVKSNAGIDCRNELKDGLLIYIVNCIARCIVKYTTGIYSRNSAGAIKKTRQR